MKQFGFSKHEAVDIISRFNGDERVVENFKIVPVPIAKRCVATYFPEANALVHIDSVAHTSNTPASKSVIVRLRKHTGN